MALDGQLHNGFARESSFPNVHNPFDIPPGGQVVSANRHLGVWIWKRAPRGWFKKGPSRTPSNGLLFISYWDGLKSIFVFTTLPHQLDREICIACIFAGGSSLVVSDSFGDNDDNRETSTCQNLSMFLLGSCCFLNNTHDPRSIAGSNSSFCLAKPLSIFLFFLIPFDQKTAKIHMFAGEISPQNTSKKTILLRA